MRAQATCFGRPRPGMALIARRLLPTTLFLLARKISSFMRWMPAAERFAGNMRRNWESLRSEEHTSELQSPDHLVCRLLLEKKKSYRSRRAAAARFGATITYCTVRPCCRL